MKYRHLDLLQNILRNLRPAVISLIFIAGLTILVSAFFVNNAIGLTTIKIHMVIIFFISLYLLIKKKINPILVMVLAGLLNVIYGFII
jgi:chromate transporter